MRRELLEAQLPCKRCVADGEDGVQCDVRCAVVVVVVAVSSRLRFGAVVKAGCHL